jgi:prepilin-type N-terminal cleavage/methylation domain-containing protein
VRYMGLRRAFWKHEGGFTLVEVMVTIIILGVLAGIAFSAWSRLIESRRVDSAAIQVVADMRLAGSLATNRLTEWRVDFPISCPAGTPAGLYCYQLVKPSGPTQAIDRSLPDGTEVKTTITVGFQPTGSAQVISGTGNAIAVGPIGVSCPSPRCRTVSFNEATARVRVEL